MPTPLRRPDDIALAACFAQLGDAATLPSELPAADAGRVWLQVTPAGEFTPSDGRAMDVSAWRMTAEIAPHVIAATAAHVQPPVIDYEHQSLHKEANGQLAPAAGWMHELRFVPQRGLFALVELTQRARQLIADGEYRYFSPVFTYDRKTGAVQRVLMGALTNTPAIHGMSAVALTQLLAAASQRFFPPTPQKEHHVSLPDQLRQPSGPSAKADVDDINVVHIAAHTAAAPAPTATAAATAERPDPAQFAPVAVVEELRSQLAALSAQHRAREVEDLIAPALADGRLLAAQAAWARELGCKDFAALSAYLQTAQPIAALTSTQTGGQPPAGVAAAAALTPAEAAVCAALGLTHDKYRAAAAAATQGSAPHTAAQGA